MPTTNDMPAYIGNQWTNVPMSTVRTALGNGLTCLYVSGVDAKTATTVTIGTTENNGQRFYPLFFVAIAEAANTVTIVPSLSVGTNSATFNNILAITAMTGLITTNLQLPVPIILSASIAPNTAVSAKYSVNATATGLTMTLLLVGFYM